MPVCQKMWQTLPFLMLFLNDVNKYVLEEVTNFSAIIALVSDILAKFAIGLAPPFHDILEK